MRDAPGVAATGPREGKMNELRQLRVVGGGNLDEQLGDRRGNTLEILAAFFRGRGLGVASASVGLSLGPWPRRPDAGLTQRADVKREGLAVARLRHRDPLR